MVCCPRKYLAASSQNIQYIVYKGIFHLFKKIWVSLLARTNRGKLFREANRNRLGFGLSQTVLLIRITLMRIRILLFTLMRIRIPACHFDPDPEPTF